MDSIDLYGVVDSISSDSKYKVALKTAYEGFNDAMYIFEHPKFATKSDWKKESSSDGAIVYSKSFSFGKAFCLTCEMPVRWDEMLREDWDEVEKIPDYNKNIAFTKIVQTLTENFDIIHYGNNDVMVVKGRDFIVARLKRIINGKGYMVARSIELDEMPEDPSHVRGFIHLGAGRFAPHPTKPDVTLIDYIMCIDLKGYIPKMIVNSVMARLVLNDYEQNKLHFEEKANNKKNGVKK